MAILNTTIPEADARLVTRNTRPGGNYDVIIRKWPYIDARYIDDLVDASPTTVTNPKADGETYTGTYNVKTERGDGEDDRSCTVVQILRLDAMIVSYESLHTTLGDRNTQEYKEYPVAVNAPADSQGNTYRANNTLREDGAYDIRLDYDQSVADTVRMQSAATNFRQTQTILYQNSRTVITAPSVTGVGMYRVTQTENGDGTYTGGLDYLLPTNNGQTSFESVNSILMQEDSRIYKSINVPIHAQTEAQGRTYICRNSINEDSSYDSTLQYRTSVADSIPFVSRRGVFKVTLSQLYNNSRAIITAITPTLGTYTVTQRENDDGTYSGQADYTYPIDAGQARFESFNSAVSDDIAVIYPSRTSPVQADPAAQGATYRAQNTQNEDGSYTSRLDYQESLAAQMAFASTHTKLAVRATLMYENSRTQLAGAPSVQGGSYTITQQFNEDGSYSGNVNYVQSYPVMTYHIHNTPEGQAYVYRFENYKTIPTVAENLYAADTGLDVGVSVSINEDETYSGTVRAKHTAAGGSLTGFSDHEHYWNHIETREYDISAGHEEQYRVFTMMAYRRYRQSHLLAESACEAAGSPAFQKPQVRKIGRGMWLASWDELLADSGWVTGDTIL